MGLVVHAHHRVGTDHAFEVPLAPEQIVEYRPAGAAVGQAHPVEGGHHPQASGLAVRALEGPHIDLADGLLVGEGGDALPAVLLIVQG